MNHGTLFSSAKVRIFKRKSGMYPPAFKVLVGALRKFVELTAIRPNLEVSR